MQVLAVPDSDRGARRQPRSHRGRILAVLTLIAAVVLAGCGVRVDSRLEADQEFSGSRSWVVSSQASEVDDYIDGGEDAAIAALEAHLPEPLSLTRGAPEVSEEARESAAAEAPEEDESADDDSPSVTLTMEFSSAEDYTTKIHQILDASGYEGDRESEILLGDGVLTTGVRISEPYSNAELLAWMPDALIAEGVLDEAQAGAFFDSSTGSQQLSFNGETYESWANRGLSVDEFQDNRFSRVEVQAFVGGAAPLIVSVQLGNGGSEEQSDYLQQLRVELEEIPGILEVSDRRLNRTDNAEAGATLEDLADGDASEHVFTFSAGGSDSATAALQLLLNNDELSLTVDVTEESGSPDVITTVSGENFRCEDHCHEAGGSEMTQFRLFIPRGWEPVRERDQRFVPYWNSDDNFQVQVSHTQYLSTIHISTEIGFTGSITQQYDFQLRPELAESVVRELADEIPFGLDNTVSVNEFDRLITVEISGNGSEQFSQHLSEFLPEATFHHGDPQGFFWPDYYVDTNLSPVAGLVSGGVLEPIEHELSLPFMHRITSAFGSDEPEQVGQQSATFTEGEALNLRITGKGPSVGGLVTILGLLVLLVVIIVVVVLVIRMNRKKSHGSDGDDAFEDNVPLVPPAPTTHPSSTTPIPPAPLAPPAGEGSQTRTLAPVERNPESQYRDVPNPTASHLDRFTESTGSTAASPRDDTHSDTDADTDTEDT